MHEYATLNASELIGLALAAQLTRRQRLVWDLVAVEGLDLHTAADRLTISYPAAWRTWARIQDRVAEYRLACEQRREDAEAASGLWQVYDALVHRVCKARPVTRGGGWRKWREIARLGW